jgi:hypothetical protein
VQSFPQSGTSIGFKGGITLPNVTFESQLKDIEFETSNNWGFNGGFFVDMISNGSYTLSSELYFNQTFVKIKAVRKFSQITNNVDYKVEYLAYGLISKYYFSKTEIKPYAFAGPNLAFYLDHRPTSSTYAIPEGTLIQITDNINKVVFSIALGAGIDFKASKKTSIFVESQFIPGLMNTYADYDVSAKTNSVEIKTGFKINL